MRSFVNKNAKYILVGLWFIVYPLMMTNGYFNVSTTKTITFMIITLIGFSYYAWIDYSKWVIKNSGVVKLDKKLCSDLWHGMSFSKKSGVIFLMSCFISFIFSRNKGVAFSGMTDAYVGLFLMIIIAIAYGIVSKHIEINEKTAIIMAVGADVVIIFAFIQFMGADLFGLIGALDADYDRIYNFLSTMGNTNVYGLYTCAIASVIMVSYIISDKLVSKIFFGISAGIGMWGILIANTDAAYLGLGIMIITITSIFCTKREYFGKVLDLGAVSCIAVILIKFVYSICENARGRSLLTRIIMNQSYMIYVIMLVALLIVRLLTTKFVKNSSVYKFVGILIRIIWAIVIGIFVMSFVYFSVINRDITFHGLEEYLRFDKEWGTQRGYAWTWLWSIFCDAGIIQKLFGAGQGGIATILLERYKTEMLDGIGYYFDNAHCVYLEILSTLGLFGLVSYVMFLGSSIVRAIKSKDYRIAIAVALIVYAGMDMVTVTRPNTIVILGLLLALCQNEGKKVA